MSSTVINITVYFFIYKKTFSSLGFRFSNFYTIIIFTKIKKGFLKKKRAKDFYVFMTVLSFKECESNYGRKELC